VLLCAALVTSGCHDGCSCYAPPAATKPDAEGKRSPVAARGGLPPPHAPGPPARETAAQLAAAEAEAQSLLTSLAGSGLSSREVAAIADIRGFRLYHQRHFREAQVWFEAAVRLDPRYEPSRYNAARAAAQVGDLELARYHLEQLKALGTPLSRRQRRYASTDPDLEALRERGRNAAEDAAGER